MAGREEKLFDRAEAILEGRRSGLGEPILWHLALRGHGPAMLALAGRNTYNGNRADLGRVANAFSPVGLMYRAYRKAVPNAAQNMAMTLFNVGDMIGYRHWIRRAARADEINANAAFETKLFETRQPHGLARRLRRLRPYRRDGG